MVSSTEGRYDTKTLVVKIGSGVLFSGTGAFEHRHARRVVDEVETLRKAGVRVILVVSGAVACGGGVFRMLDTDARRAASTFGWIRLASMWERAFKKRSVLIAPVLLTANTDGDIERENDVLTLLSGSLASGLVPIVNEFDAIQLNGFGGNDLLAAKVAILVGAQQVLIVSTYRASPYGVGGAETKQQTVALLQEKGIRTSIESLYNPEDVIDIVRNVR